MNSTEGIGIDVGEGPKLSKNQQKKEAKRQEWLVRRAELRKVERAKNKAKRRAKIEAGTYQPRRTTLMANSNNKFKVVIDMNFEDYMTRQELSKSVRQVARIYSLNRSSENPFQLYVSSVAGKIKNEFETLTGYLNWDINYSPSDYLELFGQHKKENFIYLSGDSDNTLPDVEQLLKDDSKIFIIGGLVDHNRHKNLCHKMALERGIPTSKLPLKENITLSQRHILSTINVFDILLHVLGSHKSWREAFEATIPKRKITSHAESANDKVKQVDAMKDHDDDGDDGVSDKNGEEEQKDCDQKTTTNAE